MPARRSKKASKRCAPPYLSARWLRFLAVEPSKRQHGANSFAQAATVSSIQRVAAATLGARARSE